MNELGGDYMEHVFLKKPEEHMIKEELLKLLLEEIVTNKLNIRKDELQRIYDFSCNTYSGIKRYSGDDYVTHPLNVALLLVQMKAPKNVIFAGIFCDALQKTKVSVDELEKVLPKESVSLVVRLADFDVQKESCINDCNLVLIKLAERLHNMRTIQYMEEEKKRERKQETIDFYMPIARKLGNDKLIAELNDLVLEER